MFGAIGRFLGSFALGKFLMSKLTFIAIAAIVAAVIGVVYVANQQFKEFKEDLKRQGAQQQTVITLKEKIDTLEKELKLLKQSQDITQAQTLELKNDLEKVQDIAKARKATVSKRVNELRLDATLSPESKAQAISRVYAQNLRDSQCRILKNLCKPQAEEAPSINKPAKQKQNSIQEPKSDKKPFITPIRKLAGISELPATLELPLHELEVIVQSPVEPVAHVVIAEL